jgi:hypothetical protein
MPHAGSVVGAGMALASARLTKRHHRDWHLGGLQSAKAKGKAQSVCRGVRRKRAPGTTFRARRDRALSLATVPYNVRCLSPHSLQV